jgi:hypothetical protein
MSEPTGFTLLDDPLFLNERARLRARLEQLPEAGWSRTELEWLYNAMSEEFLRRARLTWSSTAAGPGHSVPKKPAFYERGEICVVPLNGRVRKA